MSDDKKDILITVKSTTEWRDKIKQAAKRADTDMSQFIRDAVNARLAQLDAKNTQMNLEPVS